MNSRVRRPLADHIGAIARISLIVLALGAAGHLWHHLTDADCENPLRGGSHPCASCAGLHGGALAGHDEAAIAPPHVAPSRTFLPATDCESAFVSPVGPTRGPPTA